MNKSLRRILLVEDSPSYRSRLRQMLEEFPRLEVVGEATTVTDCLALVDEREPDCLFLDLQLKQGTGFDVMKSLKQRGLGLEIVVITNQVFEGYEEKCIQYGAGYFFDKSKDLEALQRLIFVMNESAGCDEVPGISGAA